MQRTEGDMSDGEDCVYLGDAVYLTTQPDNGLLLTVNNGIRVEHRIYLEPETQKELMKQITEYNTTGKLK